VHEHVN